VRIRIGNQSSFSAPGVELPFGFAVENGFDAFEWFPDRNASGAGWSEDDLSRERRALIKDGAIAHDITLSVHAPWWANPLIPESIEVLSKSIQFAQDIGASLFNIHLYPEQGVQSFVRAISPLLDRLAPVNIRLSIENTPLTGPDDFNRLFSELDKIGMAGTEHLGMCLDLGHANLCQATLNDYLKFVDLIDPSIPIIHVHLHENYGDHDSHLTIFTGPAGRDASGIDGFLNRLNRRRFSGCIIFEQWPEPSSLLLDARSRLLAMIGKVFEDSEKANHLNSLQTLAIPIIPAKAGIQRPGKIWIPEPAPYLIRDQARNDVEGFLQEPHGNDDGADHSCYTGGPADHFLQTIAEVDRQNRSWREKLRWIRDVVCDQTLPPDPEKLVYLAIYLRFIGNGQVSFQEDGHHYRPAHHAIMAREIYDRLSRITGPQNVFIVRRITPWLPSSGTEFTRAEPLTLIRDIAHRNDIPRELKSEIKHTLQNKLHRCASPEDLATSAALLARITAPDNSFSPAFLAQFKCFHEQLREFFGARSLDEQLESIANTGHANDALLIRAFLSAKANADDLPQQLNTLDLLSNLREQFRRRLLEETGPGSQQLQLADIRLEEFAFVLLSRVTNDFERQGAAISWFSGLKCLRLTIGNLRCSGFDVDECSAIESELDAWRRHFEPHDRRQVLRLKATLERARRLAEDYRDTILKLFPERVEKLGHALGLSEQAIRVYAESEIRSHVVFQLSRILDLFLRAIRELAGLSPWEVIVPGSAAGLLMTSPNIQYISSIALPVIALIDRVEGDEEIPNGVSGVIVSHQTPYLSHFAVRARQTGVVFAACEETSLLSELRHFLGRHIILDAYQGKVDVAPAPGADSQPVDSNEQRDRRNFFAGSETVFLEEPFVLPLGRVTATTAGGKAYGARRLEALSRREGADFKTPTGLVIPFGVMEASLRSQSSLEKEYHHRLGCLEHLHPDELSESLAEFRSLIRKIEVPGPLVSGVIGQFGADARLMVRSSANYEDLEELAAAGLYESVANVPVDRVADAVRTVWASLWTRRAVMSRQNLAIPHNRAHMAVLIQQLVIPDLSFIMHTVNPANKNSDEVLIELVAGLGETLASAEYPGNPFRMVCNKRTGVVSMLAFANFSHAILPDAEEGMLFKTLDYSKINLSIHESYGGSLGSRLAAIGRFVEAALGSPQDIEGIVADKTIYLVQSRPQQGIA
jgi:phosphoglucan, water dikinase